MEYIGSWDLKELVNEGWIVRMCSGSIRSRRLGLSSRNKPRRALVLLLRFTHGAELLGDFIATGKWDVSGPIDNSWLYRRLAIGMILITRLFHCRNYTYTLLFLLIYSGIKRYFVTTLPLKMKRKAATNEQAKDTWACSFATHLLADLFCDART